MVMELRRVTLLWEELWLGTLTQHHADVQRRLSQLETEIRKVNTNQGLTRQDKTAIIREKHRTILKPVSPTSACMYVIALMVDLSFFCFFLFVLFLCFVLILCAR